ncbi:hypothetical protein ACFWXK_14115 [Streptomyces sp. NPDC059070]|uniref:hypothetical protein n=1 Tax=Streptomyces sp. NPDC059070 TaxID=3346713 RepID=UPI00367474C1
MGSAEETEPAVQAEQPTCRCVIAHVQNAGQETQVRANLDTALKTSDAHAVYVACLQLMQPCPARAEETGQ